MTRAADPVPPRAGMPSTSLGLKAAELEGLERMVRDRQISMRFDAPVVEAAFVRERYQQFLELRWLGGSLFLVMLVLQACLSVIFDRAVMMQGGGWPIWGLWLPAAMLVVLVLVVAPWLPLRYFERWVGVGGALLLVCMGGLIGLGQRSTYLLPALTNFDIMLMVLALCTRLRLVAYLKMVLGAVMLLLLAGSLGQWPGWEQWIAVLRSSVLFLGMLVFITMLIESSERLMFAQRRLLEHQVQRTAELEQLLLQRSREDGVTGLLNRRVFEGVLQREWERNTREMQPLSLLLLDIDYFHLYNRHYGAEAGDRLLRLLAEQVQYLLLRPADQVFRLDGDRLAVILPGTSVRGGQRVAERLMQLMARLNVPHRWSQVAGHVTVCIGQSCRMDQDLTATAVLERAQQALARAKREGRYRVICDDAPEPQPHSDEGAFLGIKERQ